MSPSSIAKIICQAWLSFLITHTSNADGCQHTFAQSAGATALFLTGVSTTRISAMSASLGHALEYYCAQLGPCCSLQTINTQASGPNGPPLQIKHLHVIGRDEKTLDILVPVQPSQLDEWFATVDGKHASEVKLDFLRGCVTNVERDPLAWNPCVAQAQWNVTPCDSLLDTSVLPSELTVSGCQVVELTDDPKLSVAARNTAVQRMGEADMRYDMSVLGWRHLWMHMVGSSEFYNVLRLTVGDFIHPSTTAVNILMEFIELKGVEEAVLQELSETLLEKYTESVNKEPAPHLTAAESSLAAMYAAELLPVKSSFLPSDWPAPQVLHAVAVNNTIYLTQVNCAYLDFADNWVASLHKIGATNFLILAEDSHTFDYIGQTYGKQHVLMVPAGANRNIGKNMAESFSYSDPSFNLLTEKRPYVLEAMLKKGITVVWMDVDTYVIQHSVDFLPPGYSVGLQQDNGRSFCMCFFILRPAAFSVLMLQAWMRGYDLTRLEGFATVHDQKVFRYKVLRPATVTPDYHVLPSDLFPSGKFRFRTNVWAKDFNNTRPAWVHANYMQGHDTKKGAMKEYGYWVVDGRAQYPDCSASAHS